MSKIICDVCGTSYPESTTQCPICGCVRSAEAKSASDSFEAEQLEQNHEYTYVKGGRFSKANVKKRNSGAVIEAEEDQEEEGKKDIGLIISVAALVLAAVAVIVYILMKLFGGSGETAPEMPTLPQTTTQPTVVTTASTTEGYISCEALELSSLVMTFTDVGETQFIDVIVMPFGTSDIVSFSSSDESVVLVYADGMVEAVGPGNATITVTCGEIMEICEVTCDFAPETSETVDPSDPSATTDPSGTTDPSATTDPSGTTDPSATTDPTTAPTTAPTTDPNVELKLKNTDVTLFSKGEVWYCYGGDIDVKEIQWSSDNTNVVTVTNGKVVAVGRGTTTIRAKYKGHEATCIVRCNWADPTTAPTTEPTTEPTTAPTTEPTTEPTTTSATDPTTSPSTES